MVGWSIKLKNDFGRYYESICVWCILWYTDVLIFHKDTTNIKFKFCTVSSLDASSFWRNEDLKKCKHTIENSWSGYTASLTPNFWRLALLKQNHLLRWSKSVLLFSLLDNASLISMFPVYFLISAINQSDSKIVGKCCLLNTFESHQAKLIQTIDWLTTPQCSVFFPCFGFVSDSA